MPEGRSIVENKKGEDGCLAVPLSEFSGVLLQVPLWDLDKLILENTFHLFGRKAEL